MTDIILALKPQYADAILTGRKRCEFRKPTFPQNVTLAVIYASNNVRKIVGWFTVKRQILSSLDEIWQLHSSDGGVTKEEYDAYFNGSEKAMCLEIGKVHRIEPPINPLEHINGFVVPQSFRYMDKNDYACLMDRIDLLKKRSIEHIVRKDIQAHI